MNFRTQDQVIRNTTLFFYNSHILFPLLKGESIDLIISVNSDFSIPQPLRLCLNSRVLGQRYSREWGRGWRGVGGKGSQILGHHLPN